MADTQAKPAPTANDRYRSEVEDTISRLGAAAIGAAKAITTDIPGMIGDAYDMVLGDPKAPNRSNQMFEAITGIKPSGSPAEIVGSLMNPENAVKAMIVGGFTKAAKAASSLDKYAADRFESDKYLGKPDSQNFFDTGMYEGNEKVKSFISDANSSLDPAYLYRLTGSDQYIVKAGKLGERFEHPELYKLYPELKDVKVKPIAGKPGSAYFDFINNEIGLSPETKIDELRSKILHEVQHKIQHLEGWQSGQNYDILRDSKLRKAEPKLKEIRDTAKNTTDASYKDAYNRYVTKVNQDKDFAFNKYSNVAGEQEARYTQRSRNLTNAELEMDIYSLLSRGRTPASSEVRDLGSGVILNDDEVRALIKVNKITK